MTGQILGVEQIDARRVDADEFHAHAVQEFDQFRRKGGEVLVKVFRIGKGAGRQQHALGLDRSRQQVRRDPTAGAARRHA